MPNTHACIGPLAAGCSCPTTRGIQGQEWFIEGPLPPPGVYEAFVRVFDIPAGAIEIDFRNGLAPHLTFGQPERVETEQIPFTNPFED